MTEASSQFTLLIRLSNGQRMEVAIEGEGGTALDATAITVLKTKEAIAKEDSTIPAGRQRLIYKGRILEDERSLSDYGIEKGATLFLVKSAAPSSSPGPGSGSAATPVSSSGTISTLPSGPSTGGINNSGNRSQMPSMMMNPFGTPNMSQGQMPNPEQMQQMMNSPQMQGLLDNPDLLGHILQQSMQSPQMQQLMEQNPELRHLYNDPAMIQQAIQMMRNPQHMQQVMRQQDLAMSQLENMPGGFAALSNMYRNVQEPMMEAQQASRESDHSDTPSANSGGTDGATGAAMPNPWGSPSTGNRGASDNSSSSNPTSQQSNPFAAMMGGMGGNPWGGSGTSGMPNPWGGAGPSGSGSSGDTSNPWAAASGNSGNGSSSGMTNPWAGGNEGMPGFGGTGMPGMPGGMQPPNMDQMMQMLENPAMSHMMNDMVQNNPDMIRTMLEAQNPMMRQMFQGNPEMANNFIRNMFNPENMRNMMQMTRGMQGGQMPNFGAMGGGMPFGIPSMGGGSGGGEMDFSNLLQQFQNTGLGAGGAGGTSAPPSNPADRYRNQLQQLYGMGFDDEQANLAALTAAHGNLNRAVDQLLSAPPPAPNAVPATAQNSLTENASGNGDSAGSAESQTDTAPKDATEKKND